MRTVFLIILYGIVVIKSLMSTHTIMGAQVNKSEEESKLVQMRLQSKTLDRVQNLTDLMGTQNRTQIVSASLQIAESLLKNVKEGNKIYVERPDGTKEFLMFIGV